MGMQRSQGEWCSAENSFDKADSDLRKPLVNPLRVCLHFSSFFEHPRGIKSVGWAATTTEVPALLRAPAKNEGPTDWLAP
jgi:hypothetical protein